MENYQILSSFALSISLVYFFLKLFLLSHVGPKKRGLGELPKVSLLVPFRNEEENIQACCDALINLDYPKDKLEIILLNDRSEDSSVEYAVQKTKAQQHFKVLNILEDINGLQAKMNVLAQGIKVATGDFIFVTDADCTIPSNWIKNSLEYFDDNIALVSGFTILKGKLDTLFNSIQKLDWIFLQSLAYVASNVGKPFTVIGNNLAFRKTVYKQIGGFEEIGFSITEDYVLMKAILEKTDYDIRYIQDSDATVESLPVDNFSSFIKQRVRWIKGGSSGRPFVYFLIGSIFIAHLLVVGLLLSGLWNPFTAIAVGLIIGSDYLFLKTNLKGLKLTSLKKYFLLYEIFFFFYPVYLFLQILFIRTVTWKGRKYKKKGAQKQAP